MGFLKRYFYIFLIVFFFVHTLASQEHYFLHSDVSFLSQLVENSEYRDFYQYFYEVNPPLIAYIYHLFQLPTQLGIIDPVHSLRISMLFYLMFIIILLNAMFKRIHLNNRKAVLVAVSFAFLFVLPVDFLQREHFIFIGCVLYVVVIVARIEEIKLSRLIKCLAIFIWSLSICLKPQYLIVHIVIEWYYIRSAYLISSETCIRKKFCSSLLLILRWENLLIVLIGISYVTIVILYFPAYFDKVVPLARENYSGYFRPISSLLVMCGFILACTLPAIFFLRKNIINSFNKVLEIVFYSSLLVYMIGRAGFSYHLFLAFGISVCFLILCIVEQFDKRKFNLVYTLFVLFVFCIYQYSSVINLHPVNYKDSFFEFDGKAKKPAYPLFIESQKVYVPLYKSLEEITKPGDKVMSFNAQMAPFNFLRAHLNLKWVSQFPTLWPLPILLKHPNDNHSTSDLDFIRSMLVSDIENMNPNVILIDNSKKISRLPSGFDFYDFMNINPKFSEAMKKYERLESFIYGKEIKIDIYVKK